MVAQAATLLRNIGAMCLSFGLCGLGVVCVFAPHDASSLYGLPVKAGGDVSWVLVAGLRDFGLGLATLMLQVFEPSALRVFVPSIICVPLGDAALTILQGGTMLDAAMHGMGTIAVTILAVCAWLDPTLGRRTGPNVKVS